MDSSRAPSTLVPSGDCDVEKDQIDKCSGHQTPTADFVSDQEPGRPENLTNIKWFIILVCIYVTDFLYGLDATIAADIQGDIIEQFGHIQQLAWIGVGFFLGSVAVILPVGELFGCFNMKWLFAGSVACFEIGSLICGAAPAMTALIVGRVIAGIGGSGIYLGGLNMISALTSPQERGTYIGLMGFFWGLGAVLGPVVGGSFAVHATWRWAFYINLVVGAVAAPGILWLMPSINYGKHESVYSRLARLDFVGFILGAGLWTSFTMALTMAGNQWPWKDGRTIAIFIVLGFLLVSYAIQQTFSIFTTEKRRSFPVQLLRSRTQILLVVANAANITVLYIVVYFVPIYFQFVHQDSALMAAVRLLPFVIITVTFNVAAGYILPKVQYYMIIYVVSGILMTLGSGLLMGYFDPSTPAAHIYGFSVLIAIGCGMTLQTHYTISGIKAKENIGQALSLQNIAQIGGATIALVIAGQIFQSLSFQYLSQVLSGLGFSEADIRNGAAGTQSELFKQLSGPVKDQAVRAITKAMQKSLTLVVVGSAVTLVTGILMKFEKIIA
ncbi:major facilitator superfamily domain-containing protein [Mariannaea sp. PMI_226]|nr:major facilitator superfamily domain-containing protein [Mariannaea sp. PMI_226]